jgi:hypothetical protein
MVRVAPGNAVELIGTRRQDHGLVIREGNRVARALENAALICGVARGHEQQIQNFRTGNSSPAQQRKTRLRGCQQNVKMN